MKKQTKMISIIMILIAATFSINPVLASNFSRASPGHNTLYVGGSGEGNYSTIQEAIDNASDGDTVFVYSGTYYENVFVNKPINLIGEHQNNTIINGTHGPNCVLVDTQGARVEKFTLDGSSHGIIIINNSDGTIVSDCNIENFPWVGVSIKDTLNILIQNCDFVENAIGLVQINSDRSVIDNCRFYNSYNEDIHFQNSHSNKISNCSMTKEFDLGNGISLDLLSSDNDIYNCVFSNGWNGISFSGGSSGNVVNGCSITNFANQGLEISGSLNSILNTRISNCENGIEIFAGIIDQTELNTIDNCVISRNNDYGILFMSGCSHNKVINSEILNNGIGINTRLLTYGNLIFNNKFIDNIDYQALDASGDDIWDNGYPAGGNYWSDYKGFDKFSGPDQDIPGSDGIGDTPYNVPGGSSDSYPLVSFDQEPPLVKIGSPIKGLYIGDHLLRKYHLQRLPLIIGRVTIKINALDNDSGIERVEVFIDNQFRGNATSGFTFQWKHEKVNLFKHKHTIKVVAYDYAGNSASAELTVRKFL